jgi:hypothetical protein
MTLKISTPDLEGVYQGSKFLKIQVLCDAQELEALFDLIEPFWLFPLTGLTDGMAISREKFLQTYNIWIEGLKKGKIPTDTELRSVLAAALTKDLDALWMQKVPNDKYLIKIAKPIVHAQAHYFTYSSIDEVFRPMTMGINSIFWGIQFSFPQVYQDPKTMALLEVEDSVNADLFQSIRKWSREYTRATPFVVKDKRTNSPIRIGKNCFSWINNHPQLKESNISVLLDV